MVESLNQRELTLQDLFRQVLPLIGVAHEYKHRSHGERYDLTVELYPAVEHEGYFTGYDNIVIEAPFFRIRAYITQRFSASARIGFREAESRNWWTVEYRTESEEAIASIYGANRCTDPKKESPTIDFGDMMNLSHRPNVFDVQNLLRTILVSIVENQGQNFTEGQMLDFVKLVYGQRPVEIEVERIAKAFKSLAADLYLQIV